VIILSLPHGEATTGTIDALSKLLNTGDIVIDSGNSPYLDAKKHEAILKEKGVEFVDVGISGGPRAALTGACLIIGGKAKLFEHLQVLYTDIGYPGGVLHFEGVGAGHFVKMVHNAIEYGMMQSIAEGFNLLSSSEFNLDLPAVSEVYSHGSVIESRLLSWLSDAFSEYGPKLEGVKGSVDSLGEGGWAVEYAESKGLTDWAMKAAVDFRAASQTNPSFTGQILSAIRCQFGGHPVSETKP
jgi:6-phosphogluconate dehydrogenase